MNVLSLFDGISCARVALDRAGIPVATYWASEIEPNAIKVSQRNWPDLVRLGDVRDVHLTERVDLLIGGSPCQDLSIAKQDRKGLEGDRSGLFWEYVRILREVKPKWFILENVASMPKADRAIITKELGVEPVMLDASLVSAQSRKRLFWTNIPGVAQPEDRGIVLRDILQPESEVDESMVVKGKAYCLTARHFTRGEQTMVKVGHIGTTDSQTNRIYSPDGKAPTQCKGPGGGALPTLVVVGGTREGKGDGDQGKSPLGLTQRQQSNLRSVDDKAHCLTSTNYKGSQANGTTLVEQSTRIRKLTPIECERLQGLPDNYTEGIAKTNRYKCLGNAFNVDIVAHLVHQIHVNL